jgi:uncharacterized protein YegP (UPF0339 family)
MESDVKELEVFESDDGWHWHGLAGNHEILVQGESHTRREDAVRAAEAAFPELKVPDAS